DHEDRRPAGPGPLLLAELGLEGHAIGGADGGHRIKDDSRGKLPQPAPLLVDHLGSLQLEGMLGHHDERLHLAALVLLVQATQLRERVGGPSSEIEENETQYHRLLAPKLT